MSTHMKFLLFVILCLRVKSLNSNHIESTGEDGSGSEASGEKHGDESPKLLVIMFDGFRWDYYNTHKKEMNAFEEFLNEGVQAEWVKPVFPSLSYPAWTTISTGLFPESHGILGNFMYNKMTYAQFDLLNTSTTMKKEWWQTAEPVWIAATKAGKDVFLRYWSRCDVPFHGTIPKECKGYTLHPGKEAIGETLQIAAQKIKDHDLVMVYNEHIDNLGHKYGPDSPEVKQGLKDTNEAFNGFLDTLMDDGLDEKVNIIIVSDHGMVDVGPDSNVTYLDLGSYLDPSEVNIVLDRGAVAAIDPFSSTLDQVYMKLKSMSAGVNVYKRHEVPEAYHYKNNHLAHELLVVAKPQYLIRGLNAPGKQLPLDLPYSVGSRGVHGYPNMKEMNTIFFARGPAFKKGIVHPPIHLEDIYQIFASVLNIQPQPHNGSWERVSTMFINSSIRTSWSLSLLLSCLSFLVCLHYDKMV